MPQLWGARNGTLPPIEKTEFLETQPRESDVSLERFLIIRILDNDIYAFLFS